LSSGLLRTDRVGWAGFPQERSELVATLLSAIVRSGKSEHYVQILLLRKARGICSLPQDAIDRSAVDTHFSAGIRTRVLKHQHTNVLQYTGS
jgi:hypothetical protein